jgi:hypothetical protein
LASRLAWFVVDGVTIFQGLKIRVTMQLINKHSPFVIGLHYMARMCNLVTQTLSKLSLVAKFEKLLQSMYVYFFHSPNKHMEFTKLAEILETKGGKIFHNVRTWWILMLAPTKCVLQEYKTLVVKLADDSLGNAIAKNNYELLCD